MREQLLAAVKAHAQGEIAKHKANVNVYLEHPAGIGEHSDITEAIQVELDKIARYHDQVEVIDQYFKSQMAGASTEKKTSLEPSEVFCACGLLMPQLKMSELVKDQTGTSLLKWAAGDGLKLARSGIKPLDNKFVAMFNSADDKKFFNN